jgi:hypothetical protein
MKPVKPTPPAALTAQVRANVEEQLTQQFTEKLSPEVLATIDISTLVDVESMVSTMIAAQQEIADGDPVGMVRRSTDGATALRVQDGAGRATWQVSLPDGQTHTDEQPTLPWPVLFDPTA